MQRIAVYGKGGIGKSTVSANLSYAYASNGLAVLHVGCDPKHDSTISLCEGKRPTTIAELLIRHRDDVDDVDLFIVKGKRGIDLVEAGGPEPGIGCAGRGLARMFDIFESLDVFERGYDVALFDVLGDVVCGGFAAPLREGYADQAVIVLSEELMAIYAANNVARAIKRFRRNGVGLAGLVINRRDNGASLRAAEGFAERIGAPILAIIDRDRVIQEGEIEGRTVVEHAPGSQAAKQFRALGEHLRTLKPEDGISPEPLDDAQFQSFVDQFR